MPEQFEQPQYFALPDTGEVITVNDIDGLIGAYERWDTRMKEARKIRTQIAFALTKHTVSDKKTRRLRGEEGRQVRITMPSDRWDQAKLRDAWEKFPQHRDEFMKIAQIRVKAREYKKLEGMTGDATLEQLKATLEAANEGPSGTPYIKVED